jgi:shikimate dehydrogenase
MRGTVLPARACRRFSALLAEHGDLRGLNVTIPYKEAIIPYLTALHPDARAIGAVNCIAISEGDLTGYNTDWIGFRDSLQPLLRLHHRRALVLGSGGASKAVIYALQQLEIEFTVVSRAGALHTTMSQARLSLNTLSSSTPLHWYAPGGRCGSASSV